MKLASMTAHNGLDSRAMMLKLHKAIPTLLVDLDLSQRTIDSEMGPHINFSSLGGNVANVNICVGGISAVHSLKLKGIGGLILFVLSPAHANATRSNLPALHPINGSLSILLAAEGDKAITL